MKKKYIYIATIITAFTIGVMYLSYVMNNATIEVANNLNDYEMKQLDSILQDSKYIVQAVNEENDKYIKNIYYPKTINERLNKKIDEIINKYTKETEGLNINNETKNRVDINFDTTIYNNDIINIVFEIYIYEGENVKQAAIETLVYDFKEDRQLYITDVYKNNNNYLYEISKYTYNELKENENIKDLNADKSLTNGTKPNKENFSKFTISKSGIIIYFEKGALAPISAGTFKVLIPFNEIKGIFS